MPQPFVRADVRAFLDRIAGMPMIPHTREALRAQAAAGAGMIELLDGPIGELAVLRDLAAPGPAGDIPLRLFDARAARAPGPLVVFLHGGGFATGSLDSHAGLCAEMARTLDLPVLSVGYRLSLNHPFPAAPDDVEAAARWAASATAALGFGVSSLVLAGDSAGGNLAIVAALALRDRPAAVPAIALWTLYPVTERAQTPSRTEFGDGYFLTGEAMRFFDELYAADREDWRARLDEAALDGLPPTLVTTAGLDPLRDEGRAFAGRLAAAGVPVIFREAAGNIHGFATFRLAIPSSAGDVAGSLAALKPMIVEAEANRTMAQAASAGSAGA